MAAAAARQTGPTRSMRASLSGGIQSLGLLPRGAEDWRRRFALLPALLLPLRCWVFWAMLTNSTFSLHLVSYIQGNDFAFKEISSHGCKIMFKSCKLVKCILKPMPRRRIH
jgi:hypothetical protein